MALVEKKSFGMVDGIENFIYTLKNGQTEVDVMNYGATIVAIRTADKNGDIKDVVLGHDSIEDYRANTCYFGAIIGRNSNRIANAKFELNGKTYNLFQNNGTNNLHGGEFGFDTKMWAAEMADNKVIFYYTSPDMESGFPGEATIKVTYTLSENNELMLNYHAVCDQDTIVNLTNHSYFNLNGHESGTIEEHSVEIKADYYTPLDENCAVTGEVVAVKGTAYDLNTAIVLSNEIDSIPDFEISGGYDHNFILNSQKGQVKQIATVVGDKSGIKMEVSTDKPAVQFYAGNFVTESIGKNSAKYGKRSGLCLETQLCPNCQNMRHLGNAVLKKGEVYSDTTVFKFSV